MAKKNTVINEPVIEDTAPEKVIEPKVKDANNTKVLDTGKNGKYAILLVETKNKKSVVLIEQVLEKPTSGYVCYPVGQRLTVSSEMVK